MKEKIEEAVANCVEAVDGGHMDALKAFIELKASAKLMADALKQIEELAIDELRNYPKGKAEMLGAVAEIRNTAGRYSFKHVDEWNNAKAIISQVETDAKEAFKLRLKGQTLYDADGVEITPADFTEGKETVFVTLPK